MIKGALGDTLLIVIFWYFSDSPAISSNINHYYCHYELHSMTKHAAVLESAVDWCLIAIVVRLLRSPSVLFRSVMAQAVDDVTPASVQLLPMLLGL